MIFRKFEKLFKSLMPNLLLPSEFFPLRPSASDIQAALRSKRPSIHRGDARPPINTIKERIKDRGDVDSQHGDSYTDRHGDKPHGDHTDSGRTKK